MTFTVTITGVTSPVEVYGGLTALTDYLGASSTPGAAAWRALVADDQKRALVDATRYLDAQAWAGTANGTGPTTLQWPRTGVTLADGTAVDAASVPAPIVQAAFELAALIASDPETTLALDAGSNVRTLNAKGTSIEFFSATSAKDGTATSMPVVVQRLVGKYLAIVNAALSLGGGISFGTSGESRFATSQGYALAGVVGPDDDGDGY